jgi:hypothetical protein
MDDIGTQPVYRLTMADEIRANASDITELTLGKIDLGMNASDSLIDNETYEMKQAEYFINNLKPKTTALPDIRYDETEDWFLHPRDKNGFMHLSWKHDSPDINSIKISGGKIKIS